VWLNNFSWDFLYFTRLPSASLSSTIRSIWQILRLARANTAVSMSFPASLSMLLNRCLVLLELNSSFVGLPFFVPLGPLSSALLSPCPLVLSFSPIKLGRGTVFPRIHTFLGLDPPLLPIDLSLSFFGTPLPFPLFANFSVRYGSFLDRCATTRERFPPPDALLSTPPLVFMIPTEVWSLPYDLLLISLHLYLLETLLSFFESKAAIVFLELITTPPEISVVFLSCSLWLKSSLTDQ